MLRAVAVYLVKALKKKAQWGYRYHLWNDDRKIVTCLIIQIRSFSISIPLIAKVKIENGRKPISTQKYALKNSILCF